MNFFPWFETHLRLFPNATFADLIHVRTGTATRLKRYVLPREEPASIGSLIMAEAQETAEALRGAHTFSIALMEESKSIPLAEHVMRVGDAMGPGVSYDSESPTLEGVCKQLMRHTEALMRSHTLGAQHTHQSLAAENERLRTRLDAVESRHFETVALQEELLSQRHIRDLEAMRAVAGEQRKETMLRSVSTLLPAVLPTVAHKLLGRSAAPGEPAAEMPTDPAIAAFAQSLTDEQRAALSGLLRPEQIITLSMLFKRHMPQPPEAEPVPTPPKRNPGSDMN